MLILCLVATGIMPAYASEAPPEMPHQFYGTVDFDGDPVEEGTLVEAFVDDVKQAATTVDGESRYGYTPILRVPGSAGATVTFHVGGVEADADADWESGKVQELDLAIHEDPASPAQYELTISSTNGGFVAVPGEGRGRRFSCWPNPRHVIASSAGQRQRVSSVMRLQGRLTSQCRLNL